MPLRFNDFCVTLEKVCANKNPVGRKELLQYLKDIKETAPDFDDYFATLRLVLPQLDETRRTYGLKESSLAKIYAEILSLNETDQKRLRYYKDPTKVMSGVKSTVELVGNFSSVLSFVLNARLPKSAVPTTNKWVDEWLDRLWSAQENTEVRIQLFQELVNQLPPLQHKWIVRIILKNLELSIGYETVLRMIHPNAAETYNSTGQLRPTIESTWDKSTPGIVDVKKKTPKPMLAKAIHQKALPPVLSAGVAIEPKLDGERLLCRFTRFDEATFELDLYTRSGNTEYPQMYLPSLNKYFENAIAVDVQSCILDGEMVCWDSQAEAMMPFGHARTVAAEEGLANCQLYYIVFDILEIRNAQGKEFSLTSLTYLERREALKRVLVRPKARQLEIIESRLIIPSDSGLPDVSRLSSKLGATLHLTASVSESCDIVAKLLDEVQDERREGLMIKKLDSTYHLNARNKGWFKLKPDFGWLRDSLDLIMIGFYLSDGTRRRRQDSHEDARDHISTFLLALKDGDVYRAFTKCGTGYTIEELRDVVSELKPYIQAWDERDETWRSLCNNWNPRYSKDKPDYVISPSTSIVMEIIGAELVPSSAFDYTHTLRFPRAAKGRAFRRDKNAAEIATSEDVNEIITESGIGRSQLEHQQSLYEDSDHEFRVQGRQPKRRRKEQAEVDESPSQLSHEPALVSSLFKGMSFLVLTAAGDAINKLKAHSGTVVKSIDQTFMGMIISDRPTVQARLYNETSDLAVIRSNFIDECLELNKVIDIEPHHVLLKNSQLTSKWRNVYDFYGDSWTTLLTPIELSKLCQTMPSPDPHDLVDSELESLCVPQVREWRILVWTGAGFAAVGCEKTAIDRINWETLVLDDGSSPGKIVDILPAQVVKLLYRKQHFVNYKQIHSGSKRHSVTRDLFRCFIAVQKCEGARFTSAETATPFYVYPESLKDSMAHLGLSLWDT